jgi:hypothetical protein
LLTSAPRFGEIPLNPKLFFLGTSMSTDRSEDRASLCSSTFVDARHCRIPHALRAHAGISETPVSSMIYFTNSAYTGWGVQLKNLTTLLHKGSKEGMAVVASRDVIKCFRSNTYN